MTMKEALEAARGRWGHGAMVEEEACLPRQGPGASCTAPAAHAPDCPGRRVVRRVGLRFLGHFEVRGEGYSWEEAFLRGMLRDHQEAPHAYGIDCAMCRSIAAETLVAQAAAAAHEG